MQEIRWFKPSTVSRRFSVTAGSYRTLHPGQHAGTLTRRALAPLVGARRVTDLGFIHLQFEALPTAARESDKPCDFALVAMLGPPGLRIFEATGADLGEENGHRALRRQFGRIIDVLSELIGR
jgi:hypothetical protein